MTLSPGNESPIDISTVSYNVPNTATETALDSATGDVVGSGSLSRSQPIELNAPFLRPPPTPLTSTRGQPFQSEEIHNQALVLSPTTFGKGGNPGIYPPKNTDRDDDFLLT